ncbi:unnamed protein product, partial [Prorocentrum cordatum]
HAMDKKLNTNENITMTEIVDISNKIDKPWDEYVRIWMQKLLGMNTDLDTLDYKAFRDEHDQTMDELNKMTIQSISRVMFTQFGSSLKYGTTRAQAVAQYQKLYHTKHEKNLWVLDWCENPEAAYRIIVEGLRNEYVPQVEQATSMVAIERSVLADEIDDETLSALITKTKASELVESDLSVAEEKYLITKVQDHLNTVNMNVINAGGFKGSDLLSVSTLVASAKETRVVITQTNEGHVELPYWGRVISEAAGTSSNPKNVLPMEVYIKEQRADDHDQNVETEKLVCTLYLDSSVNKNPDRSDCCHAFLAAVFNAKKAEAQSKKRKAEDSVVMEGLASHEVVYTKVDFAVFGKDLIVQVPSLVPVGVQPPVPFTIVRAKVANDDRERVKPAERGSPSKSFTHS